MKTIYEIQDMVDASYLLLDDLTEAINELITENENLKARIAKETKEKIVKNLKDVKPKNTIEEILYAEYFKEQYGKELE